MASLFASQICAICRAEQDSCVRIYLMRENSGDRCRHVQVAIFSINFD
jgi:hypothetical protein